MPTATDSQHSHDGIEMDALGLTRHVSARAIPSSGQTIPEAIALACAEWPDREALVSRHARYTFSELAREINAATHALAALGVRAGDRVAATNPNYSEILIAFFAAQSLGAIWIGVNRPLATPEKYFILNDCEANYYLADNVSGQQIAEIRSTLPALRRIISMEPDDSEGEWAKMVAAHRGAAPLDITIDPFAPAGIAYTSGTTGFPKGVVHSQHNMLMVGAMQKLGAGLSMPVERAGVILPLTILNLIVLGPLAFLQSGRTSVLIDRIDAPGLAAWIRDERVETFAAVPTIIHDLLTDPAVADTDLATLKFPGVGGAPVPEKFRDLYRQKFGHEIRTGYGLTEAPTSVCQGDTSQPVTPGSSGAPLRHLRISIQDEQGLSLPTGESGEICISGAIDGEFAGLYTPMLGYWRRPEATATALRGGWLHTGDIGRVDAAGNLYVEGRRNDVILRGGANVYPAEIERVLIANDAVADAAVIGREDDRLGERVVAVIQLGRGDIEQDAVRELLQASCLQQLARYKVPEEWVFVDSMPRNAMNKVVKSELKKALF